MDKKYIINDLEVSLKGFKKSKDQLSFEIDGEKFELKLAGDQIHLNGESFKFASSGDHVVVGDLEGFVLKKSRGAQAQKLEGAMIAPMPCKVFKVVKNEKEKVKVGDTILILEAMKMEHAIKADKDGVILKLHYKVGDLVKVGSLLAEIK